MPCFKTIRAIVFIQKRIAVALFDITEGKFLLIENGIKFGKVLNDMLRQNTQLPRRHLVIRIGPASCIPEGAFFKAEFPRPGGHRFGKPLFRSAEPFSHHDTGVIAGLDDDAAQKISDADARIHLDKHLGAALFPGLLADRQGVFQIERAVLQPLEHHGDGHQLAHGCGGHELIGIFLKQDGARIHIEDKRFPRRGFNRVRCGGAYDQGRRQAQRGKKSEGGGPEIHSGRAFSHSLFRFYAVKLDSSRWILALMHVFGQFKARLLDHNSGFRMPLVNQIGQQLVGLVDILHRANPHAVEILTVDQNLAHFGRAHRR